MLKPASSRTSSLPSSHALSTALLALGLLAVASLTLPQKAAAQSLNARHAPISAHAAQDAVSRGATVLDVRAEAAFASGSLPGAVSLPSLANAPAHELAGKLSAAGVDLSREVLLLGDAGSDAVQSLHQALARVSSGQVLWLVGGLTEWQAAGGTVIANATPRSRHAVPQRLVNLPASGSATESLVGAAPQRRDASFKPAQVAELYGYARLY
jgi:rhodanese-related sulfurtransferase